MTTQQRLLIGFYVLVAIAALYATWSQNLQLMTPGMGPFDPYLVFVDQTRVNPGTRSITVDLAFLLLAGVAFMVIEARRLGVSFVWLYVVMGFLVAISVTFPLFMIARELKLIRNPNAPATWRLTSLDIAGLVILTAFVLFLVWRVLGQSALR
jgi:Terpene cyclase DEP1